MAGLAVVCRGLSLRPPVPLRPPVIDAHVLQWALSGR